MNPTRQLTEEWFDLSCGRVLVRTNRLAVVQTEMPLVLVHGLVVSGRYLLPTANLFSGITKVVVPDLPGYGKSKQPGRVAGPGGLAAALVELMDAMHLDRAHFLGNSYGCQILTELAICHPNRVARLVFVGPSVDPRHRTVISQFLRLLQTAPYENAKLPPLVAWEYLIAGPRRIAATLRHCFDHKVEHRLPEVHVPVLVVRGSCDAIVPQRWAEEIVDRLPDGQLQVMRGAGHAPNFSQPRELASRVAPFFGWPRSALAAQGGTESFDLIH